METVYYLVESINGDYAYLRRLDAPEEEPKLVAMFLLPEETRVGTKLKCEFLQYEIVQ